jgi:hypothetical protein
VLVVQNAVLPPNVGGVAGVNGLNQVIAIAILAEKNPKPVHYRNEISLTIGKKLNQSVVLEAVSSMMNLRLSQTSIQKKTGASDGDGDVDDAVAKHPTNLAKAKLA